MDLSFPSENVNSSERQELYAVRKMEKANNLG